MGLRVDEGRAESIRKVMQLTGESTKAGASDKALHHFVRDHQNKENLVDELGPELDERLGSAELPVEISIETSVGIVEN